MQLDSFDGRFIEATVYFRPRSTFRASLVMFRTLTGKGGGEKKLAYTSSEF